MQLCISLSWVAWNKGSCWSEWSILNSSQIQEFSKALCTTPTFNMNNFRWKLPEIAILSCKSFEFTNISVCQGQFSGKSECYFPGISELMWVSHCCTRHTRFTINSDQLRTISAKLMLVHRLRWTKGCWFLAPVPWEKMNRIWRTDWAWKEIPFHIALPPHLALAK